MDVYGLLSHEDSSRQVPEVVALDENQNPSTEKLIHVPHPQATVLQRSA
jgi:hypothetical protein